MRCARSVWESCGWHFFLISLQSRINLIKEVDCVREFGKPDGEGEGERIWIL